MGVESTRSFGIIEPLERERPPEQALFSVRPLNGDRYQIEHPFHGPKIIGDGSVFSDKYIDSAAALLLHDLPYLADARKLNRIGRFETRPYAGYYSQLSHCASLGIMGAEFGGGPLDIFDGLYNDAPHIYDGHQGDDNYQGHGLENLHDKSRGDFFKRSGLMKHFVEQGVLRPNSHGFHFGNTRLYIGTLLDESEASVRRTFMSNKHPARRYDGDRFQYSQEETLLVELFRHRNSKDPTVVPFALAAKALEDIQRLVVVEAGEGDQLVFSDISTGERAAIAYAELNALHWCEPVQDLVNDVLNLAERYFFVCDHNYARDFQYFYPRDYLHTSATLMFRHFDEVAKDDPFMNWLLATAEALARDQRDKMGQVIDGKRLYTGPDPMDGVSLRRMPDGKLSSQFMVKGGNLIVDLPAGKMRKLDLRIITSRLETAPLSSLRPEVGKQANELQRWIGNYQATLSLSDVSEAAILERGINLVNERWHKALARPPMPDLAFQQNINEANRFVLSGGIA